MPSNPRRPDQNNPTPRNETTPEFNSRVQDMMDQDSWNGTDRVGACYPKPGKIVEIGGDDSPVTIYRRRDGV